MSDMADIQKALDKITDQVKEKGEETLAEAQKGIKLSESNAGKIDELLTEQGKLKAQIAEMEQKSLRGGADDEFAKLKSIGYQVIEGENLDKIKEFTSAGRTKGAVRLDVKAITSISGSAGQAVVPDYIPGVNTLPNRRMTVRDLVAPGRTSSNLVNYVKESGFTNSAAITAEGVRKPESTITYTLTPAQVRKIAHFMKASSEILEDFPALQSQIDGRLRYGLDFAEELQLLKGSGTGNNLNGIYTQASAYTQATVAGDTRIDVLRRALLQVELVEYYADGIVLNPTDWAYIELTKDSQGRYLIGNPQGTLSPTLWGRPVVTTQAMTVDTFLVGAFKLAAQIFDRSEVGVLISTENEDDFVNNLVTLLIERRLALAVYRPEAMVKGDITPA